MMTLTARRWLFYGLVALFLVGGTAVIYYAQGWRLDITTGKINKIGAIYVRSFPDNANIFLNGKPIQNESAFLSRGTLISDLFPKSYTLKLTAPGYDDWQENANVSPSLVTQFKYAVLIPQNATSVATSALPMIPTNSGLVARAHFQPKLNTSEIIIYSNASSSTIIASTTAIGNNQKLAWIASGNILGVLQADGELYLYNLNDGTLKKLADDARDFSASADGTMIAALEQQSMEVFDLNDSSDYYRFNLPDIGSVSKLIWYKDDAHIFVAYPDHVAFLDLTDANLMNFKTIANGTTPEYEPETNSLYMTSPTGTIMRFNFPE